jgi:predicted ATPase
MRRFILTGAPGAGKTVILRALEKRGFGVVEEAATDVIALEQARGAVEPWRSPAFLDAIVELQKQRLVRASQLEEAVQFHDRSAVCTLALAWYLRFAVSASLTEELSRIETEQVYDKRVFFIDNLGFVAPTAARRITFEETLRFERIHEETYLELGYELVRVRPGPLEERVAEIVRVVEGGDRNS